jgi:xanthine dehydrogenase molybdopterin-binding subunit B
LLCNATNICAKVTRGHQFSYTEELMDKRSSHCRAKGSIHFFAEGSSCYCAEGGNYCCAKYSLLCRFDCQPTPQAAAISVYGDGSVLIHSAGLEMGQGLTTKVKQAAAYHLGQASMRRSGCCCASSLSESICCMHASCLLPACCCDVLHAVVYLLRCTAKGLLRW